MTTKPQPSLDDIACSWLIDRLPPPRRPGRRTTAPAEPLSWTAARPGPEECGFEALVRRFGLDEDAALARLCRIVHAAIGTEDLDADPAALGPLMISTGAGRLPGDHRLTQHLRSFVTPICAITTV